MGPFKQAQLPQNPTPSHSCAPSIPTALFLPAAAAAAACVSIPVFMCATPTVQIEFPSAGLTAAQGDGDGQNEMNWSMGYLRRFLNAFQDQAASIRVFFPDNIVSEGAP